MPSCGPANSRNFFPMSLVDRPKDGPVGLRIIVVRRGPLGHNLVSASVANSPSPIPPRRRKSVTRRSCTRPPPQSPINPRPTKSSAHSVLRQRIARASNRARSNDGTKPHFPGSGTASGRVSRGVEESFFGCAACRGGTQTSPPSPLERDPLAAQRPGEECRPRWGLRIIAPDPTG